MIWVQSNVNNPIPRPVDTPNSWLTTLFLGAIQQTHEKYDKAVKTKPGWCISVFAYSIDPQYLPGKKYHANDPAIHTMRNLNLLIPPVKPSSSAWKVFKLVATTKLPGQIIEAGQTTNRRQIPASVKPVICVANRNMIEKPKPIG